MPVAKMMAAAAEYTRLVAVSTNGPNSLFEIGEQDLGAMVKLVETTER